MMQFCMWMIDTQRMLLGRDVVAQYQIQFKIISTSACNRCDRIVWLSVCLGIDECILIGIASPG